MFESPTGRIAIFVILIFCALMLYILFVWAANRFYKAPETEVVSFSTGNESREIGERVVVTTWNLGYAGMGLESDFYMDLGEQKKPLSKDIVEKNLAGIQKFLEANESDIFLFQEVARPSSNTYGIDLLAGVIDSLPNHNWSFSSDIKTRFVPPQIGVEIGNSIFTRFDAEMLELRLLEYEPDFELGTFRKNYRMHIYETSGDSRWVFINIHLSAFDTSEHSIRETQLKQVLDYARSLYSDGAHVVVGGDWNLILNESKFPHTTEDRFLFWLRQKPSFANLEGWFWASDNTLPSVRTAHKPYVEGENATFVIDGFLVSPNVDVVNTFASDLGFMWSDHNPVTVELKPR